MKRIFSICFLFCLSFSQLYGQITSITNIPDTSFTVYNSYVKVLRKYPDATIVELKKYPDVYFIQNAVYLQVGNRKLHADIFYPKKKIDKNTPGIVLIHGGGWRSGDKTMQNPMAEEFAHQGYVAMSVEYRLSTEALYPAAVYDVKAAIKWLRSRAKKFHVDKDKIAVLGCSSGGQMASLIGTTNDTPLFDKLGLKGQSSKVQAIVNIDGLLDFTDIDSYKFDTDPQKPSAAAYWFNGTYASKPKQWKEASAITYAGPGTPPIIFINSILPHYHAGRDEFIKILDKYHVYHEEYTIQDTPHPFWLFYPWYNEMMDYILPFLKKTLK